MSHYRRRCRSPPVGLTRRARGAQQTITPWDGNETMAREVSPWTPLCGPVVPEPQTTAFEDERHARLRALSRSVGTADGVPRSRVGVGWLSIVLSVAARAGQGQRTSRTLPGVCNVTARPPGVTTMQTDAHNMGREERHALLEQRRAAVVRQLRRLAIELTDLDRQLDEIEQSER